MKVILKMDLKVAKGFFIGKTVKNMKETSSKIKLMGNFTSGNILEIDDFDYSVLLKLMCRKIQTCTYYGLNKNDIINFLIKENSHVPDRVVPIGTALKMSEIWDGYDFYETFTRKISII